MIEGRREGRREEAWRHDDGFRDGLEGGNPEFHSLHQSQPLVIFDVSRASDDGRTAGRGMHQQQSASASQEISSEHTFQSS